MPSEPDMTVILDRLNANALEENGVRTHPGADVPLIADADELCEVWQQQVRQAVNADPAALAGKVN